MASIDKIYVNTKQYFEFFKYLTDNLNQIKKDTDKNPFDYINFIDDIVLEDKFTKFPMANFPEIIDRWLLENCELDYIVKRIKYQYGLNEEDISYEVIKNEIIS